MGAKGGAAAAAGPPKPGGHGAFSMPASSHLRVLQILPCRIKSF